MAPGPDYEEKFNLGVKEIETALENEKLFCAGETADAQGKTLVKDQKQLCFRELKKHYLESMEVIFTLKKQYLALLHTKHVEELTAIQKKLVQQVEKNF